MKIHLVIIKSESCQTYYNAFNKKPNKSELLKLQKDIYISEYLEDPEDDDFTDLVPIIKQLEIEVKE